MDTDFGMQIINNFNIGGQLSLIRYVEKVMKLYGKYLRGLCRAVKFRFMMMKKENLHQIFSFSTCNVLN